MFTGLVSGLGRVLTLTPSGAGSDARFEIAAPYDPASLAEGASVSHAGCCLTVLDIRAHDLGAAWFVDVSQESLSKTTLGQWAPGARVNLERSLRAGDEFGGHIVTGHVDGVGRLVSRAETGGSLQLVFTAPADLVPMIAAKGSISVDGVSLTVNGVEGAQFEVNIIPHTAEVTSLGGLSAGDRVNLEIDILARYVSRMLETRP
ncbi:MAG: riboflavin synthase [Maricaulaceae bacterium]